MTSLERIRSAARLQAADELPVAPYLGNHGAHILELDSKVDLKTAKASVGRRVCLMGNLNPVTVLWQGTPAAVAQAAETAMGDASQGGGFILGSGCEVPVAAPQENLHAMVRAARQWRIDSVPTG